jgi:hypothetical protein
MFRDPNGDGVNESQPLGSHPDFEDDADDLPLGDLDPEVIRANLALLGDPDYSEFAEDSVS